MAHYKFQKWQDQDGTVWTTPGISPLNMTKDLTLTAYYTAVPKYSLIISASAGGTTEPIPGTYQYDEGTSAIITAIANESYKFSKWEFDGAVRTENPTTVLMNSDYSLKAVFEYVPPPPLTATITGTVKDSVSGQPILGAIITCDGYADVTEIDGSYVLTNIPAALYTLKVTKTGYQPVSIAVDASAGGTYTVNVTLTLTTPTPPTLWHTRLWTFSRSLTRMTGRWNFPLIEVYDQAARRIYAK